MSENKYPIGGYAPGETKYGKCPECNAPCEVTTKHSVLNEDGDSIEIPYDEYNYKPAGAVWVKGAPVNETNDLMQFPADYHSIFDDHIHRVLLFVWKPEGMDRIIYEVIGKGIHDFVNVENIVQYLDESGTASNKDAIEKEQEQQKAKAWDEWRDSLVTHENVFVHYKKKDEHYTEDFTLEEFKKVMTEKSPVFIYCNEWSSKIPHFQITTRVMPSSGFYYFCNAWADKTPVHTTIEEFYKKLQQPGLKYFSF